MCGNSRILAVIPARALSKGLPRKNLAMLAGKPILSYTLDYLKQSKYNIRTVLSTEDDEIESMATGLGVEVFRRRPELADDGVYSTNVVKDVVDHLDDDYDIVIELYASVPIRPPETLDLCIEKMQDPNITGLICVSKTHHNHPRWAVKLDHGFVSFPYGGPTANRQQLEPMYYITGCLFGMRPQYLDKEVYEAFGPNLVGLEVEEGSVVDIDTQLDLDWAEFLMGKSLKRKRKEAKNKKKPERCDFCGKEFPANEIIHGPDPYASEINDDYTEVTQCKGCYHESMMDI